MFISNKEKQRIADRLKDTASVEMVKDLQKQVDILTKKTAEQSKEIERLQEQIREMKTVSYKTLQEKEEDKKDWSQIVDEWINGEGK